MIRFKAGFCRHQTRIGEIGLDRECPPAEVDSLVDALEATGVDINLVTEARILNGGRARFRVVEVSKDGPPFVTERWLA